MGIFTDDGAIALIGREKYAFTYRLVFGHGQDRNFHLQDDSPQIVLPLGRKQHLAQIQDVRIATVLNRRILTYTANHDGVPQLQVAIKEPDEDMGVWDVPSVNHHLIGSGLVIPEYMHDSQYVLIYGDNDIRIAFSKNLVAWHAGGQTLAQPRHDHFDHTALKVVSATAIEQGVLIVYQSSETKQDQTTIRIGAFLCSKTNPEHVIWRADHSLAEHTAPAKDLPRSLGAIVDSHQITVYLSTESDKLILLQFENPYRHHSPRRPTKLTRHLQNPVLSPTAYEWESQAVFNSAAFMDDGRVHLLYRAMGPDGVSRIGYASSADGIHFDERLDYPVYSPVEGYGAPTPGRLSEPRTYDPNLYPSGGGWAGCEDPRAVSIDGRVYMSFMAFNGWDFMRQALTSISTTDLNQKNWQWRKPALMSKPGETHKNWVIFPEKINGKYAILHGLSPKIHIAYVDSLDNLNGTTFIDSLPPAGGAGYHDPSRQKHWDTRVRGAGAPPIKTAMGWLLLYHANDRLDPGKYKLGAMLLDLDDPTKVLYRTNAPILEPDEWYENEGKRGVVYTCGAVVLNDQLIVYYGGGDKHIAIARTHLTKFLDALATDHAVQLTPVS